MPGTKNLLNSFTVYYPGKFVFGNSGVSQFIDDLLKSPFKRIFILSIPEFSGILEEKIERLKDEGFEIQFNFDITKEPSLADFKRILKQAKNFKAESIVGIGGGSVMDTAKLIAAFIDKSQDKVQSLIDNNLISRNTHLALLPTTSGTGSEVSPNAIFFDEQKDAKVGIIHPSLVPDAAYVDPGLTESMPKGITAATGIDALTHCIEAYANKYAHPIADMWALEGIRLIGLNLREAFNNGGNMEARANVALGSVYGGMCLGPVNTAAVHALAYPLGSKYKIPHGVSNALLLPHVIDYNLKCATEKYANIALALGADKQKSDADTAKAGIEVIKNMIADFGIPSKLSDLNISESEVEGLAHSALNVQRLLKNNVKEVSLMNAIYIYMKAL